MFRKIIALLAVAACIATASGACYSGYGVYSNNGGVVGGVTRVLRRGCDLPVISTGVVTAPVLSSRIVSRPVVSTSVVSAPVVSAPVVSTPVVSTPVISTSPCGVPFAPEVCNSCRTYVSPLYRDTVGCPEVFSSCENSAVGVYSAC